MNRKPWLAAVCTVVVVLMTVVYGRVSAAAQPGDAADPLVSKSYVDTQINQLKAIIASTVGTAGTPGGAATVTQTEREAIIAETLAYIEAIYGDSLRQSGGTGAEFVTVRAEKGQTLIGNASTEIILRGGSAVAVTGVNGLCDVTGGADITNGTGVKLNHLLIVPANDGRGMTFTSDAYLMVKGGYYIVD